MFFLQRNKTTHPGGMGIKLDAIVELRKEGEEGTIHFAHYAFQKECITESCSTQHTLNNRDTLTKKTAHRKRII